ncbi:MAG: hypothetical protein HON90_16350 [Halobacteriovoraceae bacterium]|jgi:hypothetical protein|nr:hypothetical protein [Halobacteriovoraceae bacterium]
MSTSTENIGIDLDQFAQMSGFPVELIKKELFKNREDTENISLSELRKAMLTYLDVTMFDQEQL